MLRLKNRTDLHSELFAHFGTGAALFCRFHVRRPGSRFDAAAHVVFGRFKELKVELGLEPLLQVPARLDVFDEIATGRSAATTLSLSGPPSVVGDGLQVTAESLAGLVLEIPQPSDQQAHDFVDQSSASRGNHW